MVAGHESRLRAIRPEVRLGLVAEAERGNGVESQRMNDAGRLLGLGCPISRKDFLGGVAFGVGAIATGLPGTVGAVGEAPQDQPGYAPAARNGLRGSGPGSFEIAHDVRDGDFAALREATVATGERYDLVVVGAGISGLAAARFFLADHPAARILILDNHDDVGGHARRNEFVVDGRLLLANGGTYAIESPFPYGPAARGLLTDLRIDPVALAAHDDRPATYAGLGVGVFFDRATFGTDRLVTGVPGGLDDDSPAAAGTPERWHAWLARTPLRPAARVAIASVETAAVEPYPGLGSDATKDRLSRISYERFITEAHGADVGARAFYRTRTHDLFGVGIDAVTALDCWGLGFAGFRGLRLAPGPYPRMGYTAMGAGTPGQRPYEFHFPDGNATIARGLVRMLVPGSLAGRTPESLATGSLDYTTLDRAANAVRIRLGSTVVGVAHRGDHATATEVEVAYSRAGTTETVRAGRVVMASYNMMVPFVMPQLPRPQREALRYGAKVPLVYSVVAIRNWRAFATLGVKFVSTPGMFHSQLRLDDPVDIGDYRSSAHPDEAVLVRMLRTPCAPGLSEREQHRVGRANLLATPYATFERAIRDQLDRVLGPAGFDATREIAGITVNRWPHGYAYEYNPLWDPESFFDGGETPNELARRRFGRIAIANSDAAAAAYTDQAIEQAARAVRDLRDVT